MDYGTWEVVTSSVRYLVGDVRGGHNGVSQKIYNIRVAGEEIQYWNKSNFPRPNIFDLTREGEHGVIYQKD